MNPRVIVVMNVVVNRLEKLSDLIKAVRIVEVGSGAGVGLQPTNMKSDSKLIDTANTYFMFGSFLLFRTKCNRSDMLSLFYIQSSSNNVNLFNSMVVLMKSFSKFNSRESLLRSRSINHLL